MALEILFWVTFTLLLVVCAFLSLSLFNLGIRAFAVTSDSMAPGIRAGSLVLVRPAAEYRVGEVITFLSGNNSYTTHRINDIQEREGEKLFITKGDANEEVDPFDVRTEDIQGRVVLSIPYLGYAVHLLRSRTGFIFLFIIFALLMGSLLWDVRRHTSSRRE